MKVPNGLQNDEDLTFQTWKTPSIAPTHLQLKKTVAKYSVGQRSNIVSLDQKVCIKAISYIAININNLKHNRSTL